MFIIFLSPPLLAQYQSFVFCSLRKNKTPFFKSGLAIHPTENFYGQTYSISVIWVYFRFPATTNTEFTSQTQPKRVFLDGKFLRDGEPAERSAPEKLALRTWAPTALPQLEI